MELGEIISAIVTGIIAFSLFIYVSFTIRGKGPILSNTYLFASKNERKRMDVKAEYHLVSVVFGLLAIVFLLITVYIITSIVLLQSIAIALCICLIVYVIVQSVKTEKNHK
jgi:1,4-dihydroxy-2-naphthoate octaprenyltransferase